jgi:hypothetical protein
VSVAVHRHEASGLMWGRVGRSAVSGLRRTAIDLGDGRDEFAEPPVGFLEGHVPPRQPDDLGDTHAVGGGSPFLEGGFRPPAVPRAR